jgi:hypothetical protein
MKQSFDWSKGPVHKCSFEEPLYETVSELSTYSYRFRKSVAPLSEDEVRVCYDLNNTTKNWS